MAERNKLFSAVLHDRSGVTAATDAWSRSIDSVEAQEDITVRGMTITCNIDGIVALAVAATDDHMLIAQVSQAGQENDEGCMGEARINVHHHIQGGVTPNETICKASETVDIDFGNNGFEVKEDGDINLHVYHLNSSGNSSNMEATAIVRYTKGNA